MLGYSIAVGILLLGRQTAALQVTPNSICAPVCLDDPESDVSNPSSSSIKTSDISCNNGDYSTSVKAIKFKNCLDCLQRSTSVSGDENDIRWFLYNLRYAVNVCSFGGGPNDTSIPNSPCRLDTACGPLRKALQTNGSTAESSTEFGYCNVDGVQFGGAKLNWCLNCWSYSGSQTYVANFLTALKAGCEQQPKPGALLGLSGSLFTGDLVNVTSPPVNQTDSDSAPPSATTMTTGAIVGIAVGGGLLLLGAIGLFYVYRRKQQRQQEPQPSEHYHSSHLDPRGGCQSITPPLRGGVFTLRPDPRHAQMSDIESRKTQVLTSNADYYDGLEKEMHTRQPKYAQDPNKPNSGPTGALPTHGLYNPWVASRNSVDARGPSSLPMAQSAKSNRPDSYVLQTYITAGDEAAQSKLPGPPPGPPPNVFEGISLRPARRSSSRLASTPSPALTSVDESPESSPPLHLAQTSKTSSTHYMSAPIGYNDSPEQQLLPPPPPFPPPPSKKSRVPDIRAPSIPRIRIPKTLYSPPKIHVQEATPLTAEGEAPPGFDISEPIVDFGAPSGETTEQRARNANHPSKDSDSITPKTSESEAIFG